MRLYGAPKKTLWMFERREGAHRPSERSCRRALKKSARREARFSVEAMLADALEERRAEVEVVEEVCINDPEPFDILIGDFSDPLDDYYDYDFYDHHEVYDDFYASLGLAP